MITKLASTFPVQVEVKYLLDPSDIEHGDAAGAIFTLTAGVTDNAEFRPETASVRFWNRHGGSWTVVLTGPILKKDGNLGRTTRQCAFTHSDTTPPPAWVVELVEDARERAAEAIKAAP